MSGTSLDGVDLAYCRFQENNQRWTYQIVAAQTYSYPPEWQQRLSQLKDQSALELAKAHVDLGRHFATLINSFIKQYNVHASLIASHGHTVFHQPKNGFTLQIGDGAQIAALTGIDTVCDFRSKDLALGGQGAPLVPVGERLLFNKYNFCLNLGGIANITISNEDDTIAFDVCPANMALNYLASQQGMVYDEDGLLAASGLVNKELLNQLDDLDYYVQPPPKSLGIEWFTTNFKPLLDKSSVTVADKLTTVCEHIALQVANALTPVAGVFSSPDLDEADQLLITGGGAYNKFLIAAIEKHSPVKVHLPDEHNISFKEALIFALLGQLYVLNQNNVYSSVTGSARNHIGGALYKGR